MLSQLPQPDPRGWLVFDQLPDDLQAAEDATQAADHERTGGGRTCRITRPATGAERALLSYLGWEHLPAELTTLVTYPTVGVRNRRWPQLEPEGVTP